MKPCPKCGQQPTVTIHAPENYEFVGSCRIQCCDLYVTGDCMVDAIEAWGHEPRPIHIGEITSL
jgi:hypothetical protein